MLQAGRSRNAGGYRFGFQGQEADNKIGGLGQHLNYTYRNYDSWTARFGAIDPLAAKYPHNSPYAFSENRVIDGVELEGLEVILVNPNKSRDDEIIWRNGHRFTQKDAIHIVAHGNPSLILDEEKLIQKPAEFVSVLKKSDLYDMFSKNNKMVVVLYSCRAAKTTFYGGIMKQSFAQKMSLAINGTIIGSDERVYSGKKEVAPHRTSGTDPNGEYLPGVNRKLQVPLEYGSWLVYKEGVLTSVYDGQWEPKAEPTLWDNFWYKKEFNFSVTAKKLNMRSGPSVNFPTKGSTLPQNKTLTPTGAAKDGWAEVTTPDDRIGWVNSKYIKPNY